MQGGEKSLTGVRKRQQIQIANRTVFAWVIAVSIVVGACGVLAQFLIRQMIFNGKIYGEVSKTSATLTKNIKTYDQLKSNITDLLADSNLNALKRAGSDNALQVVIDALPTEEDRSALATSMQTAILAPAGVTISSFSLMNGDDTSNVTSGSDAPNVSSVPSFDFALTISGSYAQIQQALQNMERSIRPITIQSLDIEGSASQLQATITATTYYQESKSIQLKEVEVKP